MSTRALFALPLVLALDLAVASAQAPPILTLSAPSVAPGSAVTATISSESDLFYALIGSTVDSGVVFGGVALNVGTDVVILATGFVPGSGVVTVPVVPPFRGTVLDRFYLQAVTSTAANFLPPLPSAGVVVRNADLSLVGPAGPTGPAGMPGVGGLAIIQALGTVPPNAGGSAVASCPAGKRVIAGGASSSDASLRLSGTFPASLTSWQAVYARDAGAPATSNATFLVYALCATVAP